MRGHPVYAAMGTTIFEHMSGLSRELGAINLGQGFPDGQGPPALLDAAARALREKSNQYPPMAGLPELRDAVAAFYSRRQRLNLTREQVIVTSGATEALAAAIFALVQPGDDVLIFQPAYDAYAPLIRRAGGVPVPIDLHPPAWRYERAAIIAAITPRTRAMILNDPLNPTGTVASAADLAMLAEICVAHDLVAICDEVWEEVRFDGVPHRSLIDFPGMASRAVKIGSAGKIFGLTGWKLGWMCAAPALASLMARAHQFLTFTSPPPLQWAVAEGLALPDDWFAAQAADWAAGRARLKQGLESAGFVVLPNAATWFLCIDLPRSGLAMDDQICCERAVREAGVAAIPVSAFFDGGVPGPILRLCFTKPADQLDSAVKRLSHFRQAQLSAG
jgi:aspartate/methionine/tyrosine aminotransferase